MESCIDLSNLNNLSIINKIKELVKINDIVEDEDNELTLQVDDIWYGYNTIVVHTKDNIDNNLCLSLKLKKFGKLKDNLYDVIYITGYTKDEDIIKFIYTKIDHKYELKILY